MSSNLHFLPYAGLPKVPRGKGIVNLLIASKQIGSRNIHSGITELPVGASVPRHTHNAEEQVTVLKGLVRIVLDDRKMDCGPYDSTFITSGVPHEFSNAGDEVALVMVIYGSANVTRTFTDTGVTVEIGSDGDRFTGR